MNIFKYRKEVVNNETWYLRPHARKGEVDEEGQEAAQKPQAEKSPLMAMAILVVSAGFILIPLIVGLYVNDGGAMMARLAVEFGGVWLLVGGYVHFIERRALTELLPPISPEWGLTALIVLVGAWGVWGDDAALLLVARFIQSGAEELVTRGWLLDRIRERYGIFLAVVFSTLFFTYLHLPGATWATGLTMGFFSLCMAYIRLRYNLWHCIVTHTLYNWSINLFILGGL